MFTDGHFPSVAPLKLSVGTLGLTLGFKSETAHPGTHPTGVFFGDLLSTFRKNKEWSLLHRGRSQVRVLSHLPLLFNDIHV